MGVNNLNPRIDDRQSFKRPRHRGKKKDAAFVCEYKQLITLIAPLSALPILKKLECSWNIPNSVISEPNIAFLPTGTGESAEMRVGVPGVP